MSKQFSFYLTPKDFLELEKEMKKNIDFSVISELSSSKKPVILPTLEIKKMGKENIAVYLIRPKDIEKIVFDDEISELDIMFSPVIEVTRCYFTKRTFRKGRMYYQTGFYDNNETWITKDAEFLQWAEKVFRLVKRNLFRERALETYLGNEALELYKNNKKIFVE